VLSALVHDVQNSLSELFLQVLEETVCAEPGRQTGARRADELEKLGEFRRTEAKTSQRAIPDS